MFILVVSEGVVMICCATCNRSSYISLVYLGFLLLSEMDSANEVVFMRKESLVCVFVSMFLDTLYDDFLT